jgi:hypothetical protein
MELAEFLSETQADVRAQVKEGATPYAETAFSEIAMNHMSMAGMTCGEPVECQFQGKNSNANLRLSGYALNEANDRLDLFVSLYAGVDEITQVPDAEVLQAAQQCLHFLKQCAEGKLAAKLDPAAEVRALAENIQANYAELDQVFLYVLTDKVAKSKSFQTREIEGKAVRIEVMDIQRLHRRLVEGKPRDELTINFIETSGSALPCVYVPGEDEDYDYALTAIPGAALRQIYEKYNDQLLEANVRSFLNVRGKKDVNAGIAATLRDAPGRFMAYNNGIVIVADEMHIGKLPDGSNGITWLKGLQIVNGGQTTASIYFAKRKSPDIDLSRVRVPAKIIVLREQDKAEEEALVSDISRYANSQNAVKQSDLSANKPFHVEIEQLSRRVFCPDGVSRWFYERAAGSYQTMLAREGTTPASLKKLKDSIPTSRRITKTDLAKYLTAWDQRPDIVALGSQKNFDRFMLTLTRVDGTEPTPPTPNEYKHMIAKAKLYKDAQKHLRPMFAAFQANVNAYTVSLLAQELGNRVNLDMIWANQGASVALLEQVGVWAKEVHDVLQRTANGKMISEWAKKPECRADVLGARYSKPAKGIPEIRAA